MAKIFGMGKKKHSQPESVDDQLDEQVDVATQDDADVNESDAAPQKKGLGSLFNIGGGKTKKGARDAMLESVVSESEPGAVMERMKVNTMFALPANMGWVIMVLPTQDESFGGLSKRQGKDADKGNIINLINTDVINSVVTKDLLDDNALGFIPNEATLERMAEFGVLRDARYMYGVATADPETGEVFVYLVPPKRAESADGHIFNEVQLVSQGRLGLEEVVDFDLIDTMTAIFDIDEEGYGPEGVLAAMGLNMDRIAQGRREGVYPTGTQLRENLEREYPELLQGGVDADDEAEVVVDAPAEAREDDDSSVVDVDTDSAAESEDTADDVDNAAAGSTVVTVDAAQSSDDDEDDDPFAPVEDDTPGDDLFDVAQQAHAALDDEDADDNQSIAPSGPANDFAGNLSEEQQRELISQIGSMSQQQMDTLFNIFTQGNQVVLGELEALRNHIDDQEMARRGQHVSGDRDFDRDSVNEGIMQRVSEDLDLHIDAAPFHAAFDLAPRQIYQVQSEVQTPWLADQVNRLAVDLNSRMIAENQANYEERKRQYLSMLNMLFADIRDDLDYRKEGTDWSRALNAIDRDQAESWGQFEEMITTRRRELEQAYEEARQRFIDEKTARASEEYDRIHSARHHNRMASAEAEIVNLFESMGDASRAKLANFRKIEADRRQQLGIERVIEALKPLLEEHAAEEEAMFNEAMDVINEYIEKWRSDDIKQAAVWEEKLGKDTRFENAIAEYEQREEKIKSDTDARVAVLEDTIVEQRENFSKQLAERDVIVEAARANADERVAEIEAKMVRLQRSHEVELEENKRHMDSMIEQAGERATQSEENSKYFIESQKQQNWLLITIMVVLSIVFGLAGTAFGTFVL